MRKNLSLLDGLRYRLDELIDVEGLATIRTARPCVNRVGNT